MAQLGRAAGLSPSASTRLVNRLEERGLLTRILCADDRRGIYTELTSAGRTALDRARPAHDAALEAALTRGREHPRARRPGQGRHRLTTGPHEATARGYGPVMTTVPTEPTPDPDVVPSGDPDAIPTPEPMPGEDPGATPDVEPAPDPF